jgi:hypothetical protein
VLQRKFAKRSSKRSRQGVLAEGVGKVFAREGDNSHFEPMLAQQLAASQLRAALEVQQAKWAQAGACPPPAKLLPLRQAVLGLFRLLARAAADGLLLLLEGNGNSSWLGGLSFHPEFFAALHGTAAALYALGPLGLLSGEPLEGGEPAASSSFLGAGDEEEEEGGAEDAEEGGGAASMRNVVERSCALLERGAVHPQLGAALSHVVRAYGNVGLAAEGGAGALHILGAIRDGKAPGESPLFLVEAAAR